jgi:hypothetical protein
MYELALFHLNRPERERDLDADIRRRQLLKATRSVSKSGGADSASTRASDPHRRAAHVQAAER